MNIHDLTLTQLKRAVTIGERIEVLNSQLRSILGVSTNSSGAPNRNRRMSASAKRKIAAAQKARWANLRRVRPARQAGQATKKKMSPAARAKLSAKLNAYWAAKKKAGRK